MNDAAKKPSDIRIGKALMNRTGLGMSPKDGAALVDAAREAEPTPGSPVEARRVKQVYEQEAQPVGTMPPPGTIKGVTSTAVDALRGHKANVFLDKLGERAGFERSGVRLYDGLLTKFEARGSFAGGPSVEELRAFHDEELSHLRLLTGAIEELGGDPTALTPSADVSAVASSGLPQVIGDPRTTLADALQAVLVAELVDNDGWNMLIGLAEELGHDQLADRFRVALAEEDRHLAEVRRWIRAAHHLAANGRAAEGAATSPR